MNNHTGYGLVQSLGHFEVVWTRLVATPLPDGWRDSVRTFLERGMTSPAFADAVAATIQAAPEDPWRYFCACCWNALGRRSSMVRAEMLLSEGSRHG